MAVKKANVVPNSINEAYYQISLEILNSFHKYRIPVDLFYFQEKIQILSPYSRKGERLSNEQVEEIHNLCKEGLLFVSRSDHPIYSEHMVKQLDLVLQDGHLKESEIADICLRALTLNLTEFFESPVKVSFQPLYISAMVVTEWLWQDTHRIRYFLRRLQHEYSLAGHCCNTMSVGLWLYIETMPEPKRREFDRLALGLLLHDVGMGKIPVIIRGKPQRLSFEEKVKISEHPLLGYKAMHKIGVVLNELTMCTLEHHERLDGSGYPQQLKASQISPIGRLCAVADSFSAMIAERPHDEAKAIESAVKELASDEKRFDKKYTIQLMRGMLANLFDQQNSKVDT